MRTSYFPSTDSGLLIWSKNFSDKISGGGYGITPEQAAHYASVHGDFAAAMAKVEPGIRSKSSVTLKNQCRQALKNAARPLVSIIKGTGVTDEQKLSLGLTVSAVRSQIPRPQSAPQVVVRSVSNMTVSVQLLSTDDDSRGRARGTAGASVFAFIGSAAPADLSQWSFRGNYSRTSFDLTFPGSLPPGARVFLSAFWFNPRHQAGPLSLPISTNLQGGGVSKPASLAA